MIGFIISNNKAYVYLKFGDRAHYIEEISAKIKKHVFLYEGEKPGEDANYKFFSLDEVLENGIERCLEAFGNV
jgi:hypothetical protein